MSHYLNFEMRWYKVRILDIQTKSLEWTLSILCESVDGVYWNPSLRKWVLSANQKHFFSTISLKLLDQIDL